MQLPSRRRERALRARGFRWIAGADEAGRGALAGPLVAAAVVLPEAFAANGIRDSKLLTAPERELHFERITQAAVAWSVHIAAAEDIDRRGIQPVNLRALAAAVRALAVMPDYVLVDGWQLELSIPCEGVIGGDRKILAIAAASIIAKVTRDRLMCELDARFPAYGFAQHKGYGTPDHLENLARLGPSPLHRRSFEPVSLHQHVSAHPHR